MIFILSLQVRLDSWLNLEMDGSAAASIVSLRPAIDALLIAAAESPESLNQPPSQAQAATIECVKEVCSISLAYMRRVMEILSEAL